ncbi:hypothetical protein [Francisella tularensis]|uniref:hypothetical protein n=1 Tax=Francisella tularensis TaxID=263 RepID=UPI001C0F2B32|nr:hypothetical protein [Francisella tularensis]MBK2144316.1 hypothetical protein [Francisella tularensis]
MLLLFFCQAEDGIRYPEMSRGLGDVYKRQKIFRKVNNSFEKFCDAISYVFNKILSD